MENNVNDTQPQSTLRELRRELSARGSWLGIVGVATILTIAGAFDTGELMPFGPRLIYWLILVFATYAAGVVVGHLAGPPAERLLGRLPGIIVVGSLTGLAATAIVLIVNLVSFPGWTPEVREVGALAAVVLPIAVVVTVLLRAFETALAHPEPQSRPLTPSVSPILSRLPLEKRAALLALSVEDHYVRVRTEKGEELVLMRLTDAIAETPPVAGLKVHRSHWVSTDAVTEARREGDRAILTLTDGTEIPVSRANVPAIREAGLLP